MISCEPRPRVSAGEPVARHGHRPLTSYTSCSGLPHMATYSSMRASNASFSCLENLPDRTPDRSFTCTGMLASSSRACAAASPSTHASSMRLRSDLTFPALPTLPLPICVLLRAHGRGIR